MAASNHSHQCPRANQPETLAQENQKYWNSAVDTTFEPQWVKDLQDQVGKHMLSNLEWAGINPEAKPNDGNKKMLDYACGEGFLSRLLSPYFSKCIGMDIAEAMAARFNKTAREQGFAEDHVYAVQGDITSPDPGAALNEEEFFNFDLIVISMALHHIEDPQQAVAKFAERLKPGKGLLVVADWEAKTTKGCSDTDGSKGEENKLEELFTNSHPARSTVAHAGFEKGQFQEMLTKAGYEDVNFVLLPEMTAIPVVKEGVMQLFFGKGTRRA